MEPLVASTGSAEPPISKISDQWVIESVPQSKVTALVTSDSLPVTIARRLSSPPSLQNLSLEAVLSHLLALVQKRNYGDQKRALKHFLKFQLPPLVRQQLLDLAVKDSRIYTLIDLNIFELLLSSTVKRINVQNVRPFFRQSFAEMLQQLGTGLEVLHLEDSSWLQSRDLLPLTLSRMPYLRNVSLHYLANDAMLASLSRHCVRLQEIDVSGSFDVTDQGMQVLCQPSTAVDCESCMSVATCWCHPDDSQTTVKKRSRKISAPARVTQWLPRLVKGVRRHSVGLKKSTTHLTHPRMDEESAAALWPEDEEDIYLQMDTEVDLKSCIRSLRKLSVTGTQVTADGIHLILQSAPSVSIVT